MFSETAIQISEIDNPIETIRKDAVLAKSLQERYNNGYFAGVAIMGYGGEINCCGTPEPSDLTLLALQGADTLTREARIRDEVNNIHHFYTFGNYEVGNKGIPVAELAKCWLEYKLAGHVAVSNEKEDCSVSTIESIRKLANQTRDNEKPIIVVCHAFDKYRIEKFIKENNVVWLIPICSEGINAGLDYESFESYAERNAQQMSLQQELWQKAMLADFGPSQSENGVVYAKPLEKIQPTKANSIYKLVRKVTGVEFDINKEIIIGIGYLEEMFEKGIFPDVIYPHSFGFRKNSKEKVIPNPQAHWAMKATILFIQKVREINPNYNPRIVFNIGLEYEGVTYAERDLAYFKKLLINLNKRKTNKIEIKSIAHSETSTENFQVEEGLVIEVRPEGADAGGEMRAAEKALKTTGSDTLGLLIQMAAYMPKMRLYTKERNLQGLISIPMEAMLLFLKKERMFQIVEQYPKTSKLGDYKKAQEQETFKQQIIYLFTHLFDKTGETQENAVGNETLARVKEIMLGRQ